MSLAHWTDTELDRMLDRADQIAAELRAERKARSEAILRRYDRHPSRKPETWASALNDLSKLVWMALAWLVATSLLMWVIG